MLPKETVTVNLQNLEDAIVACADNQNEIRKAVFAASEAVIEATAALKRAELKATNSGMVTGSKETIRKAQLAEITSPETEALTVAQKAERVSRFDYDTRQIEFDVLRYRLRIAELMHQ